MAAMEEATELLGDLDPRIRVQAVNAVCNIGRTFCGFWEAVDLKEEISQVRAEIRLMRQGNAATRTV